MRNLFWNLLDAERGEKKKPKQKQNSLLWSFLKACKHYFLLWLKLRGHEKRAELHTNSLWIVCTEIVRKRWNSTTSALAVQKVKTELLLPLFPSTTLNHPAQPELYFTASSIQMSEMQILFTLFFISLPNFSISHHHDIFLFFFLLVAASKVIFLKLLQSF